MPDNYKIGDFVFLDLRGAPQTSPPRIEVRNQPGYDGGTAWRMGSPAVEPFQMQALKNIENAAGAKSKYLEYVQTIGSVQTLTWQGSEGYTGAAVSGDFEAVEPTKVLVLDVKMLSSQGVSVPVGFTGGGLLVTQWTLQPWIVEA